MAKVKILTDAEGRFTGIRIRCPAPECEGHSLAVTWTPPGMVRSTWADKGPVWSFNGNLDRPTLGPSILERSGHYVKEHVHGEPCWCTWERDEGEPAPFHCYVCHSFVADGRIQFLNDCTHSLKGQTVDLLDVDAPKTAQAEASA